MLPSYYEVVSQPIDLIKIQVLTRNDRGIELLVYSRPFQPRF